MKILFVAHRISKGGGQENVTRRIVNKALESGLRVHVICVSTDLQSSPKLRITKIHIPSKPAALSFPLFIIISSLLLLLHKRKEDIAYSCGFACFWGIDFIGIHFCMNAYRDLRISRHQYKASWIRRINIEIDIFMHMYLERYISSRFRGVYLPISKGLAYDINKFLRVPEDKILVIPNGTINEELESKTKTNINSLNSKRLLFLGGDWGRKGLFQLIKSLRIADKWALDVVGTGDIIEYSKLAKEWGMENRVTFHGYKADIRPFIQNAQFVILPSFYEGLPISLLESITYGTPIIYTRINGSEELFGRGNPGILIENNQLDSLLQVLLHDYNKNEMFQLCEESLKVAHELNFEKSLNKYLEVMAGELK